MIAKNKQFKIERKKLVIHREQIKKQEQNKENRNINVKPHRKYSREKKLSQIQNIEPLEIREVKKISSSRSLQKNNAIIPVYKNNKEQIQINHNKENQKNQQIQKIQLIGRNPLLNTIISDLIGKLKEKQLLFQSHINSYLIQKNYFVHVIQYLISMLSTDDVLQCNRLFHKLHQIRSNLQQIYKYAQSSKAKQRANSLQLDSNLYYEEFRQQFFHQSLQQGKQLLTSISILNQQARVKKIYTRQLSEEINAKRIIISQLTTRYEQLCNDVKGKEMELARLEELKNKFDNFVADNSQVIKQASRQSKHVENTFHHYIHSIQANSSLSFLDPQKANSPSKNHQDQDQTTKMLRECMSHLRRWMNNWNIKQQILINIKNQFISENEKINEQFQQTTKLNKEQPIYKTLLQIKNTYSKIEQSYKLANLFY